MRKTVEKKSPIRQLRETIVEGMVAEFGLMPLPFRKVVEGQNDPANAGFVL